MEERLQKILARSGAGSRRTAEQYIKDGRVSIDGAVVTDMGIKVDPAVHEICLNGRSIRLSEEKIHILLNKPAGYVTTLSDPQGRPIVTSLLKGIAQRVYPVGRLDLDTEGALLLTNDGDMAQRILHPSFEIKKTYVAKVTGVPSREKLDQLAKGIVLEGRRTSPAQLMVLQQTPRFTIIQIIIHEGRKRQVRKMFAAIGHRVLALKRVAYGNLQLDNLPSGKFRILSKQDLEKIFSGP
ncbi:MAG: rRNA pseudouridine synthase [Deltaproteobacteria bacterium]|nr:rRNA pseudouridine synthase [Deltaproteobacteria bacterium]